MKVIGEIRLENARHLAGDGRGSSASLANRLGMSRQLLSHYIGKGAFKEIGNDVARRLEEVTGKPVGWLDHEHGTITTRYEDDFVIDVPHLTNETPGGPAKIPGWRDHVIQLARLSKAWLRSNVTFTALGSLAMLTASGDSMAPTFEDGSILLVDRGVQAINTDAVFVMLYSGDLFVKRVLREVGGDLTIISDNPAYPPRTIPKSKLPGLEVLGRVVTAWNAKKL